MAEMLSHFGGVAGDVLRRTWRRSTWISGMALVSALFLTARGLDSIQQTGLFPIAALLLVSLGLAYHGVRAAAAAAHSSSFDPGDGRTFVVATRLSIASAVWFVPWMLWGASLGRESPVLDTIGAPSPLAAGLFLFGCLIATPACLIAAVHSRGWFDVLSPAHWGRQFSGRGSDLLTVYTIQAGGALLVTALMIPFVFVALRINTTAGFAAAGLAACVALGYWTSLTGRLSGSIHSIPDRVPVETEVEPLSAEDGLTIAGPALDTDMNRDLPEPPTEPQPADAPVSDVVNDKRPGPENGPPSHREPDELPDAGEPHVRRSSAPSKPVAFDVPKPARKARKTPLLDAEQRVEEAMKRFRLDPSHTLSKLAEMNQNFAPNAHVLQSLTICLHRTGHIEQSFKVARRAFPLCFEYGFVSLAAAMFYELRGDLNKLDLKQSEVLEIAKILHRADELATAAKAYSLVVHAEPREILAIKGLLDLAERILNVKNKPAAALKIYMFLLDHCTDPGMTEVIRDGITQCRDSEVAAAAAQSTEVPV